MSTPTRSNTQRQCRYASFAAGLLIVSSAWGATGAAPSGDATSPASADLNPVFARYKLDVRAQGHRPTCSVFTVAGALEYALAKKEQHATRLSVEFLNWASNREANDNDDGSFFSDLWSGFSKYGVCPEDVMPYHNSFDPTTKPSDEALSNAKPMLAEGLKLHWIKRWNPNTGLTDAELSEIKRTIAGGWPVAGGFRWPKPGKEQYDGNLLKMVGADEVFDGHSVLLVGFRDDPKLGGGGVFIIRNTGSGPRDGTLPYEYARAYMNDAVWINYDQTGAGASGTAAGPSPRELLNPMGSSIAGRNARVSSNEQPKWNDGNMDMNWLMPGESVEMPMLEGPGIITHMWFTSHAGWANELDALVLRIYYDGSDKPGVEVPLGHFFPVGEGKLAPVESMPEQVSPTGALTSFWRIPFRNSAKITVTNDNPDRSTGLYWQVDYTQLDSLPPGTPYFYARYRQEYPAVMGRDYRFADLEGSGWYVGTVMSSTFAQDGWFGEGDDFFYIDGESVPSLQGTGSEDYFNDAWGVRARTSHFFGQPRAQGDSAGDSIICYRWHILDAVNFEKSLKVTIEHKGNSSEDTDFFYLERPDFFNSVAFWYQTGEPKAWDKLPAYPQRRMPWIQYNLVRAYRQMKVTGDAKVKIDTTGLFGARPTLLWPNKTPGATLTFPFEVKEDGRYAVRINAISGPRMGSFGVLIDDKQAQVVSFHSANEDEADVLVGTHTLKAGSHTLAFGAPPHAEDCKPLTVEMLRLLKLPPEVKREVRDDNEAHFVRLGIGRAIYAYRLAYGKLPESLQALVDADIMSPNYLKDENGVPLKFKIENGYCEVESVGPTKWKHHWQGLDARR